MNAQETPQSSEYLCDENGLHILLADECYGLLDRHCLGRIALASSGRPSIIPMNYAMDDKRIVLRTGKGNMLLEATGQYHVAFEIDAFDPQSHTGWSVLAIGMAAIVTDPHEIARLNHLPLHPWGLGQKEHWITITPTMITGRRIPLPSTKKPTDQDQTSD